MNIRIENFTEMNVARVRHIGPYDGIPKAYKNLFNVWLPQSGEQTDDRPFMEVYQNSPGRHRP